MNALAEDQLDRVFAALSDPTRRAIVSQLAFRETTVGELPNPHGLSAGAITKHLKVLESAGLICRDRRAQFRPCRFDPEPLEQALAWISDRQTFWEGNFDRLGEVLRSKMGLSGQVLLESSPPYGTGSD